MFQRRDESWVYQLRAQLKRKKKTIFEIIKELHENFRTLISLFEAISLD